MLKHLVSPKGVLLSFFDTEQFLFLKYKNFFCGEFFNFFEFRFKSSPGSSIIYYFFLSMSVQDTQFFLLLKIFFTCTATLNMPQKNFLTQLRSHSFVVTMLTLAILNIYSYFPKLKFIRSFTLSILKMVIYLCGICHKAVANKHKAICCDLCNKWVCIACNNLKEHTYSQIQLRLS